MGYRRQGMKAAGRRVKRNKNIKAPKVRLIGSNGDQVGIVDLEDALNRAIVESMDLVEVAPDSDPPVCRIMDFGRYKYQQNKKLAESRKKAVTIQVKEVKFRPETAEHDYQFKLRNILKFLSDNDKVKVTLMFRGREIAHANLAKVILDRIVEDTAEYCDVEQYPKLEGRFMVMMLGPK